MNRQDYGWIAFLDDRPILSSIRKTLEECRMHMAQVLEIDNQTLIARGYVFKECTVQT